MRVPMQDAEPVGEERVLVALLPDRLANRMTRSRRFQLAWGVVGLVAFALSSLAQTPAPPSLAPGVITNLSGFYGFSDHEKMLPHRIRVELLLDYFDPTWKVAWGEFAGEPAFLPISDCPQSLHAGERIAVDGVVIPGSQHFLWDQTTIKVLDRAVPRKPIQTTGQLRNAERFNLHYVEVNGIGDSQDAPDSEHVKVVLVADGMPVNALVLIPNTNALLPNYVGKLVRVKGVYSSEKDANGKLNDLSIWVSSPSELKVIGSLSDDSRFDLPVTTADKVRTADPDSLVKVQGTVRSHDPGKSVVLWDGTGQVRVETCQTRPLQMGDQVEAIGFPVTMGLENVLSNGTYRLMKTGGSDVALMKETPSHLRLAAQVRDLRSDQIARGVSVNLQGVVSWSRPGTPFIFVSDSSGGIRVVHPKLVGIHSLIPKMMVQVDGMAGEGNFVPVVTNAVVRQVGIISYPAAHPVSLEQAMTGVEDGNWVEMRGYLRDVKQVGQLARLELSTWGGSFRAWAPKDESLTYMVGAIVRVRGVCGVLANDRRQLTGIELWVPEAQFVQVQVPMPTDLFAVPERSLGSLRQFNAFNAINQRVRTHGIVVMQIPGRSLYIEDGHDNLLILSHQQQLLHLGDRVEVVGFPGNDAGRFLLREAVFRRTGTGPEPDPVVLEPGHALDLGKEGFLVRAEGTLLDVSTNAPELRLLLQSHDLAFDARLDATLTPEQVRSLQIGSQIALTGIYQIQTDEYSNPRSFLLRLRNWKDIAVLRTPPWWTLKRMMWVLLSVVVVFLVALAWGMVVLHKNHLLNQTKAALQTANDRLETRVAQRTEELRRQVADKERARASLAEAQIHLMQASRQAGMAEVATSVLHNVGNVLNSVNVSASLVSDRISRSRVDNLARATAFFEERKADLATFLTEDPKGKLLPDYLLKLSDALVEEREQVQCEIQSLSKNVEHIKTIVAMQQNFAKASGVSEVLDPKDLMEDAIHINHVSFERHQIELVREYEPTPPIQVDRHKVLQILINLLSNAKHALNEGRTDNKRVTVTVGANGSDLIRWHVTDNGVGIDAENLRRIFSQGFTTRKDGHGFGLHSGANVARELGGTLTAHSAGDGQGATFTLELPAASLQPLGGENRETQS